MTTSLPWDHRIRWQTLPSEEFSHLPVDMDYVRDQVLRVANGNAEDLHIQELLYAALQVAEDNTDRAIMPRTWTQVMSGFPSCAIVVQRPPLIEIESITYYDTDHDSQTWGGSPLPYIVMPSGKDTKARIVLADGESWPSTAVRPDAVTITFRAGYIDESVSPPEYPVPPLIKQGIVLHVSEQYKQRSLGVINVQHSPAQLQLAHFFRKVY